MVTKCWNTVLCGSPFTRIVMCTTYSYSFRIHITTQLIQVTAQKTITSAANGRWWTSHSVGTGPGTDLLTKSDLKHNDTIINLRWSLNFLINGHNYVAAVNYKISQSLMLRRIKPSICKIKFSFWNLKITSPWRILSLKCCGLVRQSPGVTLLWYN